MKTFIASTIVAVAVMGAAGAQDFSLEPSFATLTLGAGFQPDPYEVSVLAGGDIDAGSFGCSGSIANAPDVRLNWQGGQITIGVYSSDDTTLVINGPDGQWYCIDDVNGMDPELTLSGSGQYDIWVGVFSGGLADSTLYVTEY